MHKTDVMHVSDWNSSLFTITSKTKEFLLGLVRGQHFGRLAFINSDAESYH